MTLRREFVIQLLILAIVFWLYSYFHDYLHDAQGPEWHRVAGWFIGLAAFLFPEWLFLAKRGGR